MKVAFLLALATAKRVGELQTLSCRVASRGPDISLAYLPEFVAKTESERNPLLYSFLVIPWGNLWGTSLRNFCYVLSGLSGLIWRSRLLSRRILVRCSFLLDIPLVCFRKTLSFFLRQVIFDTSAVEEGTLPLRNHSVRAVATLAAFLRNWSVSKVLEAATWRSNPAFACFYFCNISYSLDSCHLLGPLVIGSSVLP